ncbi:MAG TPA: CsbD family protein [Candidatus Angelobacter sp.]|jgi:uncharacterized protein YjbJ (UPF0337 family)|nr:CsbD family protein [Candidatus Angelobacter sp.]
MDKDRIEGKLEDVGGRVERQVGEWTGDKKLESEGAAHQVKGKIQHAVGKAKDKLRDVADDANKKIDREDHKMNREKEDAA